MGKSIKIEPWKGFPYCGTESNIEEIEGRYYTKPCIEESTFVFLEGEELYDNGIMFITTAKDVEEAKEHCTHKHGSVMYEWSIFKLNIEPIESKGKSTTEEKRRIKPPLPEPPLLRTVKGSKRPNSKDK